jgi:WD40 repeat protein
LEQFEREARALAKLNHTNIVKVLDYGIEQEQPYLVMEYIRGGTLKESLKEAIAWQKAAEILAPIARALDYVHSQKIVHRDVKPSNILLDEDDTPMLSDFGVVKLIEAEEQSDKPAIGVGVGTPDYMSPEQGMGKEIDFRADIYSLGVVFYEMVTGTKPFTADTPMAVVIKHAMDEFPLPSKVIKDLPGFVEDAILRAVQKDPQSRYANMGEFAQVLELIALGEQAPKKKIEEMVKPKTEGSRKFSIRLTLLLTFGLVGIILGITVISNTFLKKMPGSIPQGEGKATETELYINAQPTISLATATPMAAIDTPALPIAVVSATPITPGNRQSDLTLQGTPMAQVTDNLPKEIARWGIGGVNEVDWSPDGTMIALGTTSGIFVYDSQTYQRKIFINTNFNAVQISFHPDGQRIAAGSKDGEVKVWNVITGNLERQYSYLIPRSDRIKGISSVSSLSYSLDGKNLAVGYENGAINYFSVDSETPSMSVEQSPSVGDLAISADGKLLYVSNKSTNINVWDVSTHKKVSTLTQPAPATNLKFSHDRLFLLSAAVDGPTVYLWDLSLSRMIRGFSDLGGSATDFDFSNDNGWIAIGASNGEVRIYARPELKNANELPKLLRTISGDSGKALTLAFSPTRLIFATGNWEEGLKVWDAQTGEALYTLNQSMYGVDQIYLSKDAQWLVSGHADRKVRIWRVASAEEAYQFDGYLPEGFPFSPDNRFVAIIHAAENKWDPDLIRIVDLHSGTSVADLPGYMPKAFVQFTDDSKLLVMGTPGNAIVWDVSSWEQLKTHGGASGGCGETYTPESRNEKLVVISDAGIFFNFDAYLVKLCGATPKGATWVYYFENQKKALYVLGDGRLWFFNDQDVNRVAKSAPYPLPDEVFIAGDQENGWYASRQNTNLYIQSTNIPFSVNIHGQDDYRYKVAFAPAGMKIFALGSRYGSIHIWAIP